MVVRTPDETDARGTYVSLTDEGRALIDRALPDHVATERRLLAALSDAERDGLARTLCRLPLALDDAP